ncbi:MAG: hypothetical protein EXR11_12325 [Rhodospirillaceae bacterium]|nr:hypothetical protein [Rhodospirillaceae bacterium]
MIDEKFFKGVENWPVAVLIAKSPWLFPTIETIHVLALTMVVGTIAMVDLRLLGLRNAATAVDELTAEILPWSWTAFVFAVASGLSMFISKAVTYAYNPPFLFKITLIALAGLNMAIFHLGAFRTVRAWASISRPPLGARVAGAFSLLAWILVVIMGRWVGFTT